jgi:recombination protein RecA
MQKDNGTEKQKALESAIAQLEKHHGRGAVMRLGASRADTSVGAISTGAVGIDLAIGIGGVPRGRMTEIFGQEASGKTTLAYHIIAQCQCRGGEAAFIDAEHALDPVYARAVGVDLDRLLVSQPDYGEQALEVADALVRSGALDLFVVDSVAALVPRAEFEGEMGDQHVGLQARMMSQALRKLAGSLSRFNCAAVFTNQLREKIGIMFGNPEVTPGGRALKFWASVRLEVRRIESIKKGDQIVGSRTRVRVQKNKLAPPFRQAEVDILHGKGISAEASIIDTALAAGIVQKQGAWYSYGEVRLGQGREAARDWLVDNPEVRDKILADVWGAAGMGTEPAAPAE